MCMNTVYSRTVNLLCTCRKLAEAEKAKNQLLLQFNNAQQELVQAKAAGMITVVQTVVCKVRIEC